MPDPRTQDATALMLAFAERTGLVSERPPRRYLWTDAFAVCNFLGLARLTGEQRYTELALRLVDQVHHTLGRHREDDPRTGLDQRAEPAWASLVAPGGLSVSLREQADMLTFWKKRPSCCGWSGRTRGQCHEEADMGHSRQK